MCYEMLYAGGARCKCWQEAGDTLFSLPPRKRRQAKVHVQELAWKSRRIGPPSIQHLNNTWASILHHHIFLRSPCLIASSGSSLSLDMVQS